VFAIWIDQTLRIDEKLDAIHGEHHRRALPIEVPEYTRFAQVKRLRDPRFTFIGIDHERLNELDQLLEDGGRKGRSHNSIRYS